ncbi:MAG TPA: YraN family protein [Pyrinomonadaceae bacterium]|jgi:putative endonuclease|nr:YraN family protein [Pyrinomonadaceae bacterium]
MRRETEVRDETGQRAQHLALGAQGEALAIDHLLQCGYRMVAANFNLPIGRNTRDAIVNAEIDIVAYDGPTLCFIEVKTRASDDIASPQTNVDLRKRRQIARAARGYRRMFGVTDSPFRYDVVTVVGRANDTYPRIELHKAFWTDEQLRKKNWRESYWD